MCEQWLTVGNALSVLDSSASSLTFIFRWQGGRKGSEINRSTNGGWSRRREAFVIIPFIFADNPFSNKAAGNQLRESLRKWQSPPDPSTNHHIVGDRQHEGTAEWFIESDNAINGRRMVLCSGFTGKVRLFFLWLW
jgi:hypothetical protein